MPTAAPIMLSRLSVVLMGVVDTLFVSQLGTVELAACGLGVITSFTIVSFGLGTLNGVKLLSAHAHGAGAHHRARSILGQGLVLATLLGLLTAAIVPREALLAAVGGTGRVLALSTTYLNIALLAAVPLFVGNAAMGWMHGAGDTQTPMRIVVIGTVFNVGATASLVPTMGVVGAALATAGATALQALLALASVPRPRFSALADLRRVARLGLPMGVEAVVGELGWLIFCGIVAHAGESALAAHTLASRLVLVSFLPLHGLGSATCILVGQAVGSAAAATRATLPQAIEGRALSIALTVSGAMAMLFLVFADPLVSLFTADAQVQTLAVQLLGISAALGILEAVVNVRRGALLGAGDTLFVMAGRIVATWGLLVPAAWALCGPAGLGAPGAWLARLGCGFALATLLLFRRPAFRRPVFRLPIFRRPDFRRTQRDQSVLSPVQAPVSVFTSSSVSN